MRRAQVKLLLDEIVSKYHRTDFLDSDPVHRIHAFRDEKDIETAAFVAAGLAYGRATAIKNSMDRLFTALGSSPYEAVLNFNVRVDGRRLKGLVHRFTTCEDLTQFLELASSLLRKKGRLRDAFLACDDRTKPLASSMSEFVKMFRSDAAALRPHIRYLLPDPADGSACKRFNLYLRWMVRENDGIDFGLWPEVSPSRLIIPLDVHVARISRRLGLLERRSDDWKAAEEVTKNLRAFCPEDPVRYDFAIAHIGITGEWKNLIPKS